MSRQRLIVAVVVTVIVAGLFTWQLVREQRVARCLAEGRLWNGARSTCDAPRPGPILQRDNLKRT